jgi:Kef-type K+ transport system membrane component KefB
MPPSSPTAFSGALGISSPISAHSTPEFATRLYNAAAMAAGKILVTHPTFNLISFAADFEKKYSALNSAISDEALFVIINSTLTVAISDPAPAQGNTSTPADSQS